MSSNFASSQKFKAILAISLCMCHLIAYFDLSANANANNPQDSRARRLSRSYNSEGLEDNCYEKCSQKYPTEIGPFAFAFGMMNGGEHEGRFWDCFTKCICMDPVPAKKGSRGIKCPGSSNSPSRWG